jgi:hypothetical protein
LEPKESRFLLQPEKLFGVIRGRDRKENVMKKTAIVLATVAALGAAAVTTAPAEARGGRGWGPGPAIGLGLAAGALAAGAYGAYGPDYGYYRPRYYRPHYYGYGYGYGPRYAYYGPRYYRGW